MYMYPKDLRSKPKFIMWEFKDMIISTLMLLISVFIFSKTNTTFFIAVTGVYMFLTVNIEDMSVRNYIIYAFRFLISTQQKYFW